MASKSLTEIDWDNERIWLPLLKSPEKFWNSSCLKLELNWTFKTLEKSPSHLENYKCIQ